MKEGWLETAAGGEDALRVEGGFEAAPRRDFRYTESVLEGGQSEEKRGVAPIRRGGAVGSGK